MSHFLKKALMLSEIKYPWLIVLSALCFGSFYYVDRMYTTDPFWLFLCYWFSFGLAVIWGALNYISHIHLNAMYQKQNDLHAYVNQLVMSADEKLELQTYLEDYVEDLVEQGMTKQEATNEAINQFKVKEFLSLSKNTSLFNLHAHYYLLGLAVITGIVGLIIWVVTAAMNENTLITLMIEVTLFAYCIGLVGLFFVYKILDSVLYQKVNKLFS